MGHIPLMSASSSSNSPRAIDHCVLPTANLATARERLEALGFLVAPDARHPFGTSNACVYFADDTYLEPIAVENEALVDTAIAEGNALLERNRAFRAANGDEGFTALAMASDDAGEDHRRFEAAGVSAGPRFAFSRPFRDSAGKEDVASFDLAFAGSTDLGEGLFFTCQRVNAPQVDRSALQAHPNGVDGIARILFVADEPERFRKLVGEASRADRIGKVAGGEEFHAANGLVSVLDETGIKAALGLAPEEADGLCPAAIVFRDRDLDALAQRLAGRDIPCVRHDGLLVVAPAPGQGTVFAFEAAE